MVAKKLLYGIFLFMGILVGTKASLKQSRGFPWRPLRTASHYLRAGKPPMRHLLIDDAKLTKKIELPNRECTFY